jgi:poly [ADP-ribose] polymerase
MIRPSNAVYTGSMFSNGIYFAPKCQKSIGYTSLSGAYWTRGGNNTAYMALFEVAYGTPYVIYQHDSSCYHLNYDVLQNKNPKCNCLHAKADKGMLRNDEIVFYRNDQMTIKYLIEIGN